MADTRTPGEIAASEVLRQRQVAERHALIEAKAQADVDAQAWDGDHVMRHDVQRKDQAENDPYSIHYGGCNYLVLDLDHDPLARIAAEAYAKASEKSHPKFSAALSDEIDGVR